jgi:hypothetical protein
MNQEFAALLDERIREIAREVVQEISVRTNSNPSDVASAELTERLNHIKAKEHVTVKEAAFLLSCSESHIRKLVVLSRKGKAHRPIRLTILKV